MGLGTGLNALLSYIFTEKCNCKVEYSSIEKYPLELEEAKQMNFLEKLNRTDLQNIFNQIHALEWNREHKLSDNFSFLKINEDLKRTTLPTGFDLVYFDAFAPEVQPELWSREIFGKIHSSMASGAVLMTYCVKGSVRNVLKDIGFELMKLKGPASGKREVLKAIKI